MRNLFFGFGWLAWTVAALGCNGEAIGGLGADASTDATDGRLDAGADARVGADGRACCPIDPQRSGCMHLGGTDVGNGSCGAACDFWCSQNWRIEKDSNGCDEWKYDVHAPAPGQNAQCLFVDAGPSVDGGSYACGSSSCALATEFCYAEYGGANKQTYACKPLPTACASDPSCACVEPTESAACSARPGLITCETLDAGIIVGCSL